MVVLDNISSADVLGMFANVHSVTSLIYAEVGVTQNHCLLTDVCELQGRVCQSQSID